MQSGCCELLRVGQAYENAPEVSCFVPAHINCPILVVAAVSMAAVKCFEAGCMTVRLFLSTGTYCLSKMILTSDAVKKNQIPGSVTVKICFEASTAEGWSAGSRVSRLC